jgi:hypothetical protein
MLSGTILRYAPVVLSLAMACGGKQGGVDSPGKGSAGGPTSGDGGVEAAAPLPRPFANTQLEAQSLIQEQIDAHMKPLWKCVADHRAKGADPHKGVMVDIGIDQEGTLLGIKSPNPTKGDLDPALRDCMLAVLHGLPFPRSHAGIITVRQTFTDVSVAP